MNRIKILLLVLCTAFIFLGLTLSASALPIITPSTTPVWTGNSTPALHADDVVDIVYGNGSSIVLSELYKQNVGGSESGTFASSYNTSFDSSGPSDATITYLGSPFPVISNYPLYLVVKDGNHSPAWYIFDLWNVNGNVWNGTDTIYIQNFWVGQGAISYVGIYGGTMTPPPQPSPEPATLLLLGLGLLGLAGTRRNFKG